MTRKSRFLIVSAAGSANAFGTIQSVRHHCGDSVFVIATDTNPRELIAASVLADDFVQVPPARSPEFPEALRKIAASYPGSYYLPVHDDELEITARLAAEHSLPAGLELIAPPYDVVRLCSDKWAMHQWLRANNLPSPETALATPAVFERMRSPAILKPREGYASRGVRLIHAAAELADLDSSHWLLQERLREPEVGIDVFLSRGTGKFCCACREYLERRANVPTKVRVFADPVLADIAERLARGIPLFGAFLFQVMQGAASRWQIIDVNPRVGGQTRMSAALGLDFAAANLADFWGESTDTLLHPLTGEHFVVRASADYVTSRSPRPVTRQ
jgi:carbamoyl-phosphate synthase large subunit